MADLIDTGGERLFWVVMFLILSFLVIGVVSAFTNMSVQKEKLFQENYRRHYPGAEGESQVIEGEIIGIDRRVND